MPRHKPPRVRYPQRCKICGHSWLSFTWKGPKQCPNDLCGACGWRVGPRYLTPNRKAQGWKRVPKKRGERVEWELEGTELYRGAILVEPLGEVVEEGELDAAIKDEG